MEHEHPWINKEAILLDLMEHEHLRITGAPIDDHFLAYGLKVKPCPFDDCKQDPAKCPFLHNGEKGRRDLLHCCLAGLEFSDLKAYLNKKEGGFSYYPHPLDAAERATVQFILDQKSTGMILGYQPSDKPTYSFNNVTGNPLANARIASDAIFKFYEDIKIPTGGTFASKNASILKKNVCPTILHSYNGYPGPQQGLFSGFPNEPYELSGLSPNHTKDIVAVAYTEERIGPKRVNMAWAQAHLLSTVDALPGGTNVPNGPNLGRDLLPLICDSGASMHVVGDKEILHGYEELAQPWQIAVADGYSLVVRGIGFIARGAFIIPNVFYVEGLRMNLISVSQLDRDHGLLSCFHDGICKILKRGGDVIGGGFLQANGLYALSFLQVLAETGEEADPAIIQEI